MREAVADVVARQVQSGIDVVNDGEMGKVSYATYVTERLSGFGGKGTALRIADVDDYPDWAHSSGFDKVDQLMSMPACVDDVAYANRAPLEADIDNLRAAVQASSPRDVFLRSLLLG